MGLFTGFLRPAQQIVASPNYHNDLVDAGAAAMAAGATKSMQLLAHLPPAPARTPKLADAPARSVSRARTDSKRRQLNIRVNNEMHRALKASARRRRLSMTDLVIAYCEAGLAADRQ